MKLTLDRMCIQSGRLCQSCKNLYQSGEVGDIDIEIGKVLMNTAKSQRFLSDIKIIRIVETSNNVFIVAKKGDKSKLENAGDHLKNQLKKVTDKKIQYLEKTKNAKKLLEDLLDPVEPEGNSTILLPPDGEKELKVQISKDDKGKLSLSADELSSITTALLGMRAHYSYI